MESKTRKIPLALIIAAAVVAAYVGLLVAVSYYMSQGEESHVDHGVENVGWSQGNHTTEVGNQTAKRQRKGWGS
ncbi:hypothetical protein [Pyrobaculum neutrophilum]|uniref:Uncharacterized protein n=1 Tax=Pyrobaculum neutrophilum (strain DSM 2338 / JCM 9278 / NBRC 100436 / V24Sta) TaxID=444157 RepID=B1Y8M4_PYRNV|nr:hypothetical protein [Pyrobaculum neutrophilum]ACB40103.1 hypothetical protein Tneu_1174 [Pyrobaculum neutrophilum V24Sta]